MLLFQRLSHLSEFYANRASLPHRLGKILVRHCLMTKLLLFAALCWLFVLRPGSPTETKHGKSEY